MRLFQQAAIPIMNSSAEDIELMLEPEGNVVILPAGGKAIVTIDVDSASVDDLELEYGKGRVTLYASCLKEVTINGVPIF